MPPLLSKVTVQSVVTMTDTLLSFTVYPAMPSWVETRVLVGISCDTPFVPMTFILKAADYHLRLPNLAALKGHEVQIEGPPAGAAA